MRAWQNINGFTLIELLAVVAMIAILIALLLPVLSNSKKRAEQTICLNNLRQINFGVRMYSDDSGGQAPATNTKNGISITNAPWIAYKELMKNYVGLHGASSPQDRIFACPADTFYYEWSDGYVPKSHHDQSLFDYSSYTFNGLNLAPAPAKIPPHAIFSTPPGIGGLTVSSIRHPARTVMVAESPTFWPYSWHDPKPYDYKHPHLAFNNAKDMVSFVDGHVAYIQIYWGTNVIKNKSLQVQTCFYDPPAGYDYQWSPN